MAKTTIHIGKKIKEILDKSSLSVVDFATSINLTRNGAYKVFEKETIDTGQLQTISKVLNHDFFKYYESVSAVKESKTDYGYATKEDLTLVTQAIFNIAKELEKLREELALKTSAEIKKTTRTKKRAG